MTNNLSAMWLKVLFRTPLIDFASAVLIKDISTCFSAELLEWQSSARQACPP